MYYDYYNVQLLSKNPLTIFLILITLTIFLTILYFENKVNQINTNTEMIKYDIIISINLNDSTKFL